MFSHFCTLRAFLAKITSNLAQKHGGITAMKMETSGEIVNHKSSHLEATDLYSLDNETHLNPFAYPLG